LYQNTFSNLGDETLAHEHTDHPAPILYTSCKEHMCHASFETKSRLISQLYLGCELHDTWCRSPVWKFSSLWHLLV